MGDLIEGFSRHLRIAGRRPATISTYAGVLRRLDRILPWGLARACHDELVDAIYDAGHMPAGRALYRAVARAFYAWAAGEDGPLDFNPATRLPRVRVPRRAPRPAAVDVVDDILARARAPHRTWFALAALAGMRCVEISCLDREHVDRETVLIVGGKGGRQRTVPCHPAVWAAVSVLPPGPVARRPGGERADRRHVSRRGNRALSRLGAGVTMHQLRHYFGTHTYRAGGEFAAQQLLGHASPVTTAVYAQVASERLVAAVAALPTAASPDGAGGP